jgi:D-lactate dehydrogenase (cytochrome)
MEIMDDPEVIRDYLGDEGVYLFPQTERVEAVYYPLSEGDVKKVVDEANRRGVFCTVSGAGTSTRGGRIPVYGGIVLSMEKMLRPRPHRGFEEITAKTQVGEVTIYLQREEMEAWVGPGVPIGILSGVLPRDLFWPPDPTETSAFIGGSVATNASGARSLHYGQTRRWVSGIDILLGGGETLRIEREKIQADRDGRFDFRSESGKRFRFKIPQYRMPKVKSSAGLYTKEGMDLVDLFIGSEGILGVFTGVRIRLLRREEFISDIAFFSSTEDALGYVDALRKEKGVLSIEYLDNNSLNLIRDKYPEIKDEWKACVIVEIPLRDEDLMGSLATYMERFRVKDDWYADDEAGISKHKEFRHALPETINAYLRGHGHSKIATDLAVPPSRLHMMMRHYNQAEGMFRERFKRPGPHTLLFGHIGEAHLHLNFIPHSKEEMEYAEILCLELAKRAISLGGTVSGEHGIGKRYIPYLELMYGKRGLDEIARIKGIFDPNGILNPGNMIPLEYLKKTLK